MKFGLLAHIGKFGVTVCGGHGGGWLLTFPSRVGDDGRAHRSLSCGSHVERPEAPGGGCWSRINSIPRTDHRGRLGRAQRVGDLAQPPGSLQKMLWGLMSGTMPEVLGAVLALPSEMTVSSYCQGKILTKQEIRIFQGLPLMVSSS